MSIVKESLEVLILANSGERYVKEKDLVRLLIGYRDESAGIVCDAHIVIQSILDAIASSTVVQ